MAGELLRKAEELEVDPANPFAGDCLERSSVAERLTRLAQSTEQPFVLSIEAPWGSGKTSFIRMWKAHLEQLGHPCLLFNAWEVDFIQDPLIALLGELDALVREQQEPQLVDDVVEAGSRLIEKVPKAVLQRLSAGTLEGADIEEILAPLTGQSVLGYKEAKRDLESFRGRLKELAESVTEWKGSKPPVIIFVDELDRCRPDFALQVLERIKHLFNVGRIFFVLSLDRRQLRESLKTLYGGGMDADGYLSRFIDLSFRLPLPPLGEFLKTLDGRFGVGKALGPIRGSQDAPSHLVNLMETYATAFSLSLRQVEQIYTTLNIVVRTGSSDGYLFLPYLLCLRLVESDLYERLRCKERMTSADTVREFTEPLGSFDDDYHRIWIEGGLVAGFVPKGHWTQVSLGLRQEEEELETLREFIRKSAGRLPQLTDEIELAADFRIPG